MFAHQDAIVGQGTVLLMLWFNALIGIAQAWASIE